MEFVQVNLTTPYLFFIVPSTRVSPKPEKTNYYSKSLNGYPIIPITPEFSITPITPINNNREIYRISLGCIILNFEFPSGQGQICNCRVSRQVSQGQAEVTGYLTVTTLILQIVYIQHSVEVVKFVLEDYGGKVLNILLDDREVALAIVSQADSCATPHVATHLGY